MKTAGNFRTHMKTCEELARKAESKGNPPVGCIILNGNQIIAKAAEASRSKEDITCHAEIEAIRQARKKIGADMSGCTLITPHEPCVMCGYAIRFHKIGTVVYKKSSHFFGGINSSMNVLTTADIPDHWNPAPKIIPFNLEN